MKTKIPTHVLGAALGRLSTLKFFPQGDGALRAIGEILKDHCRDEHQLKLATDEILRTEDEWPGPASFVKMLKTALPERPKISSAGVDPNAFWVPSWLKEEKNEIPNTNQNGI